jgi:exodeoxyribonuclease VII large subunit
MQLKEGTEVEILGRITVYEPRGNYQLNVKQIRPRGIGALQVQFELLKQKLKSAGLFDDTRKKKLPYLPACVGVITSQDGAALHDFLHIIHRRFTGMHIRIYPAAVQGTMAVQQLIAGIRYFNTTHSCDVIVLTRGGGSIEDLWAFNDEKLAYAVADSKIPIISAIGHEVDFTICDFIADMRAPTPSAAAELVVDKRNDLVQAIDQLRHRLIQYMRSFISLSKTRVDRARSHYVLREPVNMIHRAQQQIDENTWKLQQSMLMHLRSEWERWERLTAQLRTLDPHQILARGYAILINENDNTTVSDSQDVNVGDTLRGLLASGTLYLRVIDQGNRLI